MKTAKFDEKIGRSWLIAEYNGKTIEYAFPPVQGKHQDCYIAISSDAELTPAEGLDLALLANGAFSRDTPQWRWVKEIFKHSYIRVPVRILWMPKKDSRGKKNELAGIIVERDLSGKGLSTKMNIPNVSGWKNEDGIYVNAYRNVIWVPEGSYKLGEVNEKDGFRRAVLTAEGAEIYIKTARDNKRIPSNWGIDTSEITEPKQRVADLIGHSDWLDLGGDSYGDNDGGYAFGVRKASTEGAKPAKK